MHNSRRRVGAIAIFAILAIGTTGCRATIAIGSTADTVPSTPPVVSTTSSTPTTPPFMDASSSATAPPTSAAGRAAEAQLMAQTATTYGDAMRQCRTADGCDLEAILAAYVSGEELASEHRERVERIQDGRHGYSRIDLLDETVLSAEIVESDDAPGRVGLVATCVTIRTVQVDQPSGDVVHEEMENYRENYIMEKHSGVWRVVQRSGWCNCDVTTGSGTSRGTYASRRDPPTRGGSF